MDKKELIEKLQDIEWEDFEVKEALSEVPKSSWETVSAFSNTAGGWLVFGVLKTGKHYEVRGVRNPEKIEQDFLTTLRGDKFNKKIKVNSKKYNLSGKIILAFYIPSVHSKDKPIYFNTLSNAFIRTGSGDQRATKEEIDALYRNASFDKKDEELTDFRFDDLDEETIQKYRTFMKNIDSEHRYNELSNRELLEKLRVLIKEKVTIGGLLIFGKEDKINDIISDFRIDYLEIRGTSYSDAPAKYQYRLPQDENVFCYYFNIFERLIKKIEIPFQLNRQGFREENQPQVKAMREALVNLLIHTDYFSKAKPRIRVFSDRIEFFNPGSLPKDLKYIIKEDFSMPRNSIMAKAFRMVHLAEGIGSGFDKMIKGWKSYYGLEPIIEGNFDYYKIVFPFGAVEKTRVKTGVETRVKTGVKILELLKENPSISTPEIAQKVGLTIKGVEWNLKKLRESGVIERVGPTKGGQWKVNK